MSQASLDPAQQADILDLGIDLDAKKKDIDTWLAEVDYSHLNSALYVPSPFALTFMNFIKLVNGEEGESNKTPPMHLSMLDKIATANRYIANLVFRGSGKTTLFIEYLSLYLGIFRHIPNFGEVSGMIYVSDSMDNGVASARNNIEYRYMHSDFLQEWIPKAKFTENFIQFQNKNGEWFGMRMFGAKTGLRGTKIYSKRPVLAVLDDLVGDKDADSQASMKLIKDTVYKGVSHALDPNRKKIILNGTPFNKQDIVIEAVESGGWDVSVWPVCERFPCTREEFRGAWPDRFGYDTLMSEYKLAVKTGKTAAFYQELMLQITSEEERLVQDGDIRWYSRPALLAHKGNFNFYITTDFATSERQKADYSVIFVWAYNSHGHWFWVDGICRRQTMDKTINDLFRLVQEYAPQQVGIEVTGQQGAFIKWLQDEQMNRNVWFNFATSENGSRPGIRPTVNKLARFNLVVPWFKAGRFFMPEEMRDSQVLGELLQEIRLATQSGLKGKDDCIDATSMLAFLQAWKPSNAGSPGQPAGGVDVFAEPVEETQSALASYLC